jgi:hypothetical protein
LAPVALKCNAKLNITFLFYFGDKTVLSESDLELITHCRNGNSDAWEKVVREYSRSVYNLA